ncbi:FadR/GntR family transcriptional regulator [Microbacterium stercoris]|uniref:FadR family transcriptional regulator n=1 Tax=Microbacterium stercoris TaxID=2820289 RepID=A0A939QMF8_9MICO|nr:FCD domain-containing protein [Microbacterium stercoris]MBO3662136.1 FadR family transcriptional regulator [Microbacterium stercoris]
MVQGMHGDVLDAIGRRAAAGALAPGDVLTLAQLEAEHGASRTVVREAVRVLESLGILTSRRRVGITVQPREQWDALAPAVIRWNLAGPGRRQQLEALMELRVAVEPTAARLAATRATPAQRDELRALAERLRDLGLTGRADSDEFMEADVDFHRALLRASGNPQLAALEGPVSEELRGRTRLGLHPRVPAPGTLDEHLSVALAIAAGEPDDAERLSRAHLLGVWSEIAEASPA